MGIRWKDCLQYSTIRIVASDADHVKHPGFSFLPRPAIIRLYHEKGGLCMAERLSLKKSLLFNTAGSMY